MLLVLLATPVQARFLEGKVRQSDGSERVPRPGARDLQSSLSIVPSFSGGVGAGVTAGAPEPGGALSAGVLDARNFDLPLALRGKIDEPDPVIPDGPAARKFETTDPLDKILLESQWNCLPCLQQHLRQRRDELLRQRQSTVSAKLYMPEVSGSVNQDPLGGVGFAGIANGPGGPTLVRQPVLTPSDAGVEENIAWDDWYKHVAQTMYERWSAAPKLSGQARVRVTVYNDRSLLVQTITTTNDSKQFADKLTSVVAGMSGAAVLAFPANSRRQTMIFDVTMDTGYDTKPGFSSKVAGDMETVRGRKR